MIAIAAATVRRPGTIQAGGELIEISFTDRYGAQRNQLSNNRRALLRPVSKRRTGGGGDNLRQIDIVFDGERHAVQRQRGRREAIQRRQKRLLLLFAQNMDKQPELGVQRLRPLADIRQHAARRGFTGAITLRQGCQA